MSTFLGRPFVADPYSTYLTGASEWNNNWAYGAFIANQYMNSGNFIPEDPGGNVLPLNTGDLIFYNWQYSGDQLGNSFFANHDSIIVSPNGIDPNNGWQGALIDQHTTDRQDAIWNLIPYNSQFATTQTTTSNAPKTAAGNRNTSPHASNTRTIKTPSSPAGQLAYSGAVHVQAKMPAAQIAAVEQAFQTAMIARQQVISVPSTAPTTASHRPTRYALQNMSDTAIKVLPSLFAGTELTDERAIVRSAQGWEANSDIRALGGGASNFHYALVRQLSPTRAEPRGTLRTWARVAQIQTGGRLASATPSNTLDVDVIMTRTSSGWRVSNLAWAFAPGSQP